MIIINSYRNTSTSPAAQNLLVRSEEFSNASWTNLGGGATVTANPIAAPDATTTADLFKAGNTGFGGLLRQAYTYSAIEYTASIYLKKNNYDYIGLRSKGFSSTAQYPFINLSNNATSDAGVGSVTVGVDVLSDGWVRFWVTYTSGAGASYFDIAITNGSGNIAGTPAGTEQVYVWGAQLNTGALRSYSKTVATNIP